MGRARIAVLTPARNAAHDLPDYLASVEQFADLVVALDDGSTDETLDLLRSAPIVAEVLTNPRRATYAGWDDAQNRHRLLRALDDFNADWVLFLDADERIDRDDSAALRRFVHEEAVPGFVFGFQVFRMIDGVERFDAASGLWVYRMFAYEPGLELATRRLHFVPAPVSIPTNRWLRTTVRIQHVGSMTEARRAARFHKYLEADPEAAYQDDYSNLLRPPQKVQNWPTRSPRMPPIIDHETQLTAAAGPDVIPAQEPVLSAVVISQNDELSIGESIRALVEQEVDEDFEVILVTSGTDATAEIVRDSFPSVRVIELPKPALPGAARNAGLWVARGDYVTFPGSHVALAPGSLQARLDAHEAGWDLVTGTTLNGNETRAGWASYFLDHSGVLPERDSGELGAAPAHCSYIRGDLDLVGGFPEDMRAGEDTVVNQELYQRGRRAYREKDAAIIHSSPSRTVRHLFRHHFVRGRAWGRILLSRSASRRSLVRTRFRGLLRMPIQRFRTVSRNVRAWGGNLRPQYTRARALVAIGAIAAAAGTWYELLFHAGGSGLQSADNSDGLNRAAPLQARRVVAEYGSPLSTRLGALGFGSSTQAADRLARVADGLGASVAPAMHVLGTAATITPGTDGSHSTSLTNSELSSYLAASRRIGGRLIVGIQPGWTSFPDAVLRHRSLIGEPGVGVALEPAWRALPPAPPGCGPGHWDRIEIERALEIIDELRDGDDDEMKLVLIHCTPATPWPDGWRPPTSSGVEVVPLVDMVGGPEEKLASLAELQAWSGSAGVIWNYRYDVEIMRPHEALTHDLGPRVIVYR